MPFCGYLCMYVLGMYISTYLRLVNGVTLSLVSNSILCCAQLLFSLLRMYVYMYVSMVCVCVFVFVCMCVCTYVCVCVHKYIHTYIRANVCVCMYTHVYVCVYVCVYLLPLLPILPSTSYSLLFSYSHPFCPIATHCHIRLVCRVCVCVCVWVGK